MPEVIRVLLADDHGVLRHGLRLGLEQAGGLEVVAEASMVSEAIALAVHEHPDVVVIGVQFPDGSGIQACREILDRSPTTAVLILTAFNRDSYLAGAREAGAVGFLVKEVDLCVLVSAIRQAAQGQTIYSVEQQDRIRRWHEQTESRLAGLSAREMEVFQLVAAGHTNAEIAEHLEVSIKTIESHVTRVLHKLGVATRREAIAWAKQTDAFGP